MANEQHPPSPPGHWLFGHAKLLRRDFIELLEQLPREFGDVIQLRVGPYKMVLLSHPAAIEQVLIAQGKKFQKPPRFVRLVRPAFGNGLIASRGEAWKRQRRALQSVLESVDPAQHCRTIVDCVDRHLAEWAEGEVVDLADRMISLSLAGRAKTTLGVEEPELLARIEDQIREFLIYFVHRLRSPLGGPLWLPTVSNRRMRAALQSWWSLLDKEIQRADQSDHVESHLLSGLLGIGKSNSASRLTCRQIRDELATWLLAGTETAANTLAWACYELARNQPEQERLFEEVKSALRGQPPQYGDQTKLPFLHGVLSESMRLYPQGYVIGRRACEPFTIADFRFPKTTTVLLNQWSIGRDPRWFDDPQMFQPDRWTGNLQERLPRFAFFPFGGGSRACVGRSTVMLELPMILATIVQRFHFTLTDDAKVRPTPSITLRPEWECGAIVVSRR